jgi:hypothetical protein
MYKTSYIQGKCKTLKRRYCFESFPFHEYMSVLLQLQNVITSKSVDRGFKWHPQNVTRIFCMTLSRVFLKWISRYSVGTLSELNPVHSIRA